MKQESEEIDSQNFDRYFLSGFSSNYHKSPVYDIKIVEDNFLLTASYYSGVKCLDLKLGKVVRSYEPFRTATYSVDTFVSKEYGRVVIVLEDSGEMSFLKFNDFSDISSVRLSYSYAIFWRIEFFKNEDSEETIPRYMGSCSCLGESRGAVVVVDLKDLNSPVVYNVFKQEEQVRSVLQLKNFPDFIVVGGGNFHSDPGEDFCLKKMNWKRHLAPKNDNRVNKTEFALRTDSKEVEHFETKHAHRITFVKSYLCTRTGKEIIFCGSTDEHISFWSVTGTFLYKIFFGKSLFDSLSLSDRFWVVVGGIYNKGGYVMVLDTFTQKIITERRTNEQSLYRIQLAERKNEEEKENEEEARKEIFVTSQDGFVKSFILKSEFIERYETSILDDGKERIQYLLLEEEEEELFATNDSSFHFIFKQKNIKLLFYKSLIC